MAMGAGGLTEVARSLPGEFHAIADKPPASPAERHECSPSIEHPCAHRTPRAHPLRHAWRTRTGRGGVRPCGSESVHVAEPSAPVRATRGPLGVMIRTPPVSWHGACSSMPRDCSLTNCHFVQGSFAGTRCRGIDGRRSVFGCDCGARSTRLLYARNTSSTLFPDPARRQSAVHAKL